MLINNEIIEKLTTKQKIALLTDSPETAPELKDLNVQTFSITELKSDTVDENGEIIFPSFSSIANSWDTQLFGDVMQAQAKLRAADGTNLFVLPKSNSAQSVYGEEITEDPYLAGKLFAGAARNLTQAGAAVCMHAPTVSKSDIDVMDSDPDEFVLFERVARPFRMAKNAGTCLAVLKTQDEISEDYQRANQKMINAVVENNKVVITRLENGDNTVSVLNQGSQVIGGSNVALETAYDNYKRIYHSMEEGGATAHELEMAILDGAAVSDEIIDNALDQKISLTKKCAAGSFNNVSFSTNAIAEESARKSVVLVKNNENLLPLRAGRRVALFGDIISNASNGGYKNFISKISTGLKAASLDVVGYSRGYLLDDNVSKEELSAACQLAGNADVAIVFLGFGKEREEALTKTQRLCLPANQIALISSLAELNKKIIAVICSSRLPSMSFDSSANSVLLVPPQGKGVAEALSQILVGGYNPEGKLAYAGYDDIDAEFRKAQKRKRRGEQKIGQYIGYRYTDIIEGKAKYPFGHGLSYTKFKYSSLSMNGKAVSFILQNTGKTAGTEITQIYLTCSTSTRQRPVKELKAICKTYLEPKQKKIVSVDLEELGIYDCESGKFVVESGEYTVFAASSAADVRLSCKIQVFGQNLKASNERISDYLHEMSNIRSESYTMEAHCKPMSKVSKLKTASAWLFVLTIFSDIIYGICGLLFGIPFKEQLAIFITLNAVVLSISLILRIAYRAAYSKAKRKQKKKEKEATAELFKNAQRINASSVEKLFADEFDQHEAEQTKKTVTYKGEAESIYVYMAVETDFQALCKDLEKHFESNGMIISAPLAKNVVASLMSSRLLVLRNKDSAVSKKFAHILSSFFGTTVFTESQADRNWEKETLLYSNTSAGIRPRILVQAIYDAHAQKQNASFYAMTDVSLSETADFLMPYVQFLGNPNEVYTVKENSTRYEIPSNLWFVIVPNENESIDSLPAFIANLASVIDLDVQIAENAPSSTIYIDKSITPQQMEALKYRSKKAVSIEEQVWKSVDSLEEFINERTPYHIGNKIFLQLESYLSVYLSSGGVTGEAVDGMLSSRLLPTILSLIKDNAQMAEVDFVQTVESIFGEEYIERSSKLIKHLVINNKEEKAVFEKPVAIEDVAEPAKETVKEVKEEAPMAEEAENAPNAEQTASLTTEKTEEGDANNAE